MTVVQKLDYIATRIIMEDRAGITSHTELREYGVLSPDQYRRRLNREYYDGSGGMGIQETEDGGYTTEPLPAQRRSGFRRQEMGLTSLQPHRSNR